MKAAQESGFHSRVRKSCGFRVLTFQADSPIYAPFCCLLSSSSTSSPFGCITPWYFNFFFFNFSSLLHSYLLSQSVLVPSLGASLTPQDLPFVMCRQSPCLTKPTSPSNIVRALFHPFPCFYAFPISPPFSHSNTNQSCIFFLPCCWTLFLSPDSCLYLMLSCLTALFAFNFWKSGLGF